MLKPIMPVAEPTVAEQPVEEPPAEISVADIFADIDLPPEPTLPADADILDTDNVFHATSEDVQGWRESFWDIAMVDTAAEAYQSEAVISFFNDTKAWAEKYCGANTRPGPPEVSVYFKSRAERELFKEELPGTWTTDLLDSDEYWWFVRDAVGIIDQTDVYYTLYLIGNWDPCFFRNP